MTLHLKDLLADILRQRPKISLAELAARLEEEVEAQVQDRVADLRTQLEAARDELTLDRIEGQLLQNYQQDDDRPLVAYRKEGEP